MSKSAARKVGGAPSAGTRAWFCGHCGSPPEVLRAPAPSERVCKACGLGLLQGAPVEVAPHPAQPFMIVDSSLSVQAVSERAEQMLRVREDWAVNRHVTEFLLPDPVPDPDRGGLAPAITRAARGEQTVSRVRVKPATIFASPRWVKVASCGPPHAALVVFD